MGLRGPGAFTSPVIDAKVIVLLHLEPEWLTSLVVCPGSPYWTAAHVDDKVAIFLHAHGEPPIAAPQHLPISDRTPRCQIRSIHVRRTLKVLCDSYMVQIELSYFIWGLHFHLRGHSFMTSANFLDFLNPSRPLSAFGSN